VGGAHAGQGGCGLRHVSPQWRSGWEQPLTGAVNNLHIPPSQSMTCGTKSAWDQHVTGCMSPNQRLAMSNCRCALGEHNKTTCPCPFYNWNAFLVPPHPGPRPRSSVRLLLLTSAPAYSLVGFNQPKPASQQYFSFTKNQHQPAQTSTSSNQRTDPSPPPPVLQGPRPHPSRTAPNPNPIACGKKKDGRYLGRRFQCRTLYDAS